MIANPRSAWRTQTRGAWRGQIVIIKFKVQISKFKVISMFKVMKMFKVIDFRALTAITLFLLALLFSLPNLLIAILLMILISALLELIKLLAEWHPLKCSPQNTKAYPIRIS